ncbi:hypothetical protein ACI01nite_16950 [Acetobacter cibinongensis]|uniref:Uncharacterized protein n=1 Tax=Acetobacter cibinongensis TaxID=146475 RepID=A0A0D6N0V6_9PROT|nr:hypothetical protein [Acetobacter cibinongensis]GAN59345.1 hypothetical protein Abci_003_108 [Acetobacter cibinongensis]GEL59093.1 hypothetical protein ACI01nite_16950 [Acetobacter cibinongensis]
MLAPDNRQGTPKARPNAPAIGQPSPWPQPFRATAFTAPFFSGLLALRPCCKTKLRTSGGLHGVNRRTTATRQTTFVEKGA